MSSAPTTAGELIGFLRLDPSDWKENSAEVKADAKELGKLNPTIRIDVDSAKALTQLSAVAAATKKLQDAQGQVTVSQAKLKDAQDSGTASASKLAAASEAVEKAMRAERVASIQLASAHENLASAGDSAESSLKGITGAASSGVSTIAALGGGIVALATTIGPLLAVGAGAFGTLLLGAQGLLPVIESGLTPAFHDLQAEAESALGPGINAAVTQLAGALPQLKPLVDVFGTAIGNAGAKFATWLNNGGISSFVQYTKSELPVVTDLAKSGATALVDFFASGNTTGNNLISDLSDVLKNLDSIDKTAKEIGSIKINPVGGSPGKGTTVGSFLSDINSGPSKTLGAITAGVSKVPSVVAAIPHLFSNKSPSPAPTLGAQALHDATNGQDAGLTLNSQAMHAATNDLDDNAKAILSNAAAYGTSIGALSDATTAADAFKDSTAASTLQMQLENNAAGLLSQALSGLGGNALGVASSATAFHAAVSGLNDTLKTNGATLDINTEKGQANRQAIEQAVAAAQAHAAAIAQQTGSTQQATDAYNDDITTLEKQLGATGLAKQAIDQYVTSIDTIPPLKSTTLDIEAAVAVTAANLGQSVHDAVNGIGTTPVKVPHKVHGGIVGKSIGGSVAGAGTGTSDSVPIMASNGEYVVQAKYATVFRSELDNLNSGKGFPAVPVAAPTQQTAGPAVFHLYDSSGVLMGSMRGVADAQSSQTARNAYLTGGKR